MGALSNITVTLTFKDNTTLSLNGKDDLEKYELLKEFDTSKSNITGSLSANELTLAIINDDAKFTPTNTNSPYYGKLDDQIKIVVTDGVVIEGTFYVTEWKVPTNSDQTTAEVVAVDRLQSVLNTPVSITDLDSNIMLKDYLKKVFNKVGFADTDIIIDQTLTQMFTFTVTDGSKLSSILNDVALSGDVYINIDEMNRVIVSKKTITGATNHTITSEAPITSKTRLISVDTVKSSLNSNNALVVDWTVAQLSPVKEILPLRGMDVKVGEDFLRDLKVTGGNVYDVDHIRWATEDDVVVRLVSVSQTAITIRTINPKLVPVKCDISIFGRTCGTEAAIVERKDDTSIAKKGRQELKIASKLTQTFADADALADKLWSRLTKDVPYVNVETDDEGFFYHLGEIVNVVYPDVFLNFTGYIHSIKYMWDGGDLVETVLGVKAI
jgi:hypothetical protein